MTYSKNALPSATVFVKKALSYGNKILIKSFQSLPLILFSSQMGKSFELLHQLILIISGPVYAARDVRKC